MTKPNPKIRIPVTSMWVLGDGKAGRVHHLLMNVSAPRKGLRIASLDLPAVIALDPRDDSVSARWSPRLLPEGDETDSQPCARKWHLERRLELSEHDKKYMRSEGLSRGVYYVKVCPLDKAERELVQVLQESLDQVVDDKLKARIQVQLDSILQGYPIEGTFKGKV